LGQDIPGRSGPSEVRAFLSLHRARRLLFRFYEINPITGKRRYRRAVLSRPRGWGKSPLLAALCIVEALAPVVPDGWDANGQPVGRPWCTVRTPLVQVAAVSEQQTKNTWTPLLEMLDSERLLDAYPGLEPLGTFVNLPRGRIEPITSSPRSVKGNRAVFAALDQTEEWVKSNGGRSLYEKMKNNAAKLGGSFVESPNAYIPGEESVAEQSAAFASAIREGRARDDGLFYDHREAPPETDMHERESLVAGLRFAYGTLPPTRMGVCCTTRRARAGMWTWTCWWPRSGWIRTSGRRPSK
jgi:phage terminase large subunit-like protein